MNFKSQFEGQTCQTTTCSRCNSKTQKFEAFMDLIIPIPNQDTNYFSVYGTKHREKSLLESALRAYQEP